MGKVFVKNASIYCQGNRRSMKENGKSEGGLQFKNERYLNADTIETMKAKNLFKFKGVCHGSTKKEKRFVLVSCCPRAIWDCTH